MTTLLQLLAVGIPALVLGALVIAGAYGLLGLASPAVRGATRWRSLIASMLAIGIGGGLFVWQLFAGLSCFLSDAADCVALAQGRTLWVGSVAAVVLALSAAAAYGMVARRRPGRSPLAATLGGPVAVLLALVIAGGSAGVLNGALAGLQAQTDASSLATRSGQLHVTVSNIRAEFAQDRSRINRVRMHVVVHSDGDLAVDTAAKDGNPRFELRPPGDQFIDAPVAGPLPVAFAKGSDTAFDLDVDVSSVAGIPSDGGALASTNLPPQPGVWLLELQLIDASGLDYVVDTNVDVGAA